LEDTSRLKDQIASKYINVGMPSTFKNPSKIRVAKVILKLLPVAIHFRRDRREWVRREGRNVNEAKYRRHAKKALSTFIELGPSYIKLGQWLSTRADMLPLPYLEELAKLQDNVPPAPFTAVKPTIERELGEIEKIFESFNTSPISGASLGQVYLARYQGKDVVVKVSRPNIEEEIESDIYILKKILPLATRFIDPNMRFSAEGMLSQFIETIHEEMDYTIEANNLLTIKQNLAGDSSVIIPGVFPELTRRHILTLEYIPGIKVTDIAALDKMGIDREKLVVRIHRLFFKMLLQHNIFHADPHPGNISVTEDGTIILYDYGMVGRLDEKTRLKLVRLYLALVSRDATRTVNILIELGTLEATANRYVVTRAIELSIQSLHGQEVDRLEVKALMELANKTLSRFPFRLPKNLALYMRMTSILEGIYHYHNVRFKFIKVLSGLLEEQGLAREAYIEEVKTSFSRIVKSIESSLNIAPLLQSFLETQYQNTAMSRHGDSLTAGMILASGLFIGSILLMPYNVIAAYAGIGSALVTIGVTLARKLSAD
jgi:predicted unusual protein kinase regulating ubiquinone biosynthesis (AarF/ABC1/UbiB family)